MTEPKDGVVFVATGKDYVAAARAAARTVRTHLPGIAVDLFSDVAGPLPEFDAVHAVPRAHRRAKVDCLALTRFENTLYLDSDVRVVADVRPLFGLLERFDLAMAHAHARCRSQTTEPWRTELPEPFGQLNTGVLLYRRAPAMLALLEAWARAFEEAGFAKDQVTLRELVWQSDLRLYVLPPEYNLRYRKYLALWDPDEARPKILHMRAFAKVRDPAAPFDAEAALRPRPSDRLIGLWKRLEARRR